MMQQNVQIYLQSRRDDTKQRIGFRRKRSLACLVEQREYKRI